MDQLGLQHDILLSDTFFKPLFLGAMLSILMNNELAITEIDAQVYQFISFFLHAKRNLNA